MERSLDFVVAGVFYRSSLVIGYFFFVFSNLLLDFANRQIQGGEDGRGLRGGNKIGRMLGRYVHFNGWFVRVFHVYSHFDRVDPIEQSPHFSSLFQDDRLVFGL